MVSSIANTLPSSQEENEEQIQTSSVAHKFSSEQHLIRLIDICVVMGHEHKHDN